MNQSEIKQGLLRSGIALLCWPDARNNSAEFEVTRVPHCTNEIQLARYPLPDGQQSRLVVQPPASGEAGVTLTDAQWQVLCEIADAT